MDSSPVSNSGKSGSPGGNAVCSSRNSNGAGKTVSGFTVLCPEMGSGNKSRSGKDASLFPFSENDGSLFRELSKEDCVSRDDKISGCGASGGVDKTEDESGKMGGGSGETPMIGKGVGPGPVAGADVESGVCNTVFAMVSVAVSALVSRGVESVSDGPEEGDSGVPESDSSFKMETVSSCIPTATAWLSGEGCKNGPGGAIADCSVEFECDFRPLSACNSVFSPKTVARSSRFAASSSCSFRGGAFGDVASVSTSAGVSFSPWINP